MKGFAPLAFVCSALACSKEPAPTPAPSASAPAVVASASAAPEPKKPEPRRPYNVLLLMIDSLRTDMPWNGYERDIAPWLTAFEKRCVRYERGYSLSSYTAKSVWPAIIGEYPSATRRDGYFFTRYPDENVYVTERLQDAGHRTLSGQAHGYFLPMLKNHQGFDDYRMIPGGVDLKAVTSVTGEKLTKLAMEMLGDEENTPTKDRKFFAYFHYLDPHHTYERHAGHPDFGKEPRDRYDTEVHYTDHWVGKLLDWVFEKPWGKDTVIIITADHGEAFGEHGHLRHSFELWEVLVRVPWFFYVPGLEGRRISVPRGHIDLAPTIADLMGLDPKKNFRGKSLVPEIFGLEEPEKRPVLVDLPRSDLMDRRRGMIYDGYKILSFGDDKRWKLYNLDKDPDETKDLVESDPEAFERMKKAFEREWSKVPNVPIEGATPLRGAPPGRGW